jgi:hypothetical protein
MDEGTRPSIEQMREWLAEESRAGFDPTEIYHVTTFHTHRTRADGEYQAVRIDIIDCGKGPCRFNVEAHGDDGSYAVGNGAENLRAARGIVHWQNLDEKAQPDEGARTAGMHEERELLTYEQIGLPMPDDKTTALLIQFLLDQIWSLSVAHQHAEEALLDRGITLGANKIPRIHDDVERHLRERWAERFDPDQEAN